MKNNERVQIEKNRKNFSVKSMYFNRYLPVRYVSALFFFTNIYWLISLWMSDSSLYFIPLILIITLVISSAEQVKIYSSHTNNPKYTKYSFMILLFSNVILMIPTCFSSTFNKLYPFLLDQRESKIAILIILIVGSLLSIWILYCLNKIKYDQDKHFEYIKKYEEAINYK